MVDWADWHSSYDDPGSPLSRRLAVVRAQLSALLDAQPPGPIRIVSLCAGEGRDVIPVVAAHPRRDDVSARLVELDPRNVAAARAAAPANVEVVEGDASLLAHVEGAVPAGVVLACGIFGNIGDADIVRTIDHLPMLCAPGAAVIWTRGDRGPVDLRPAIRRWFAERGFEERFFHGEPDSFGVGVHRLVAEPQPLEPAVKLFTFIR